MSVAILSGLPARISAPRPADAGRGGTRMVAARAGLLDAAAAQLRLAVDVLTADGGTAPPELCDGIASQIASLRMALERLARWQPAAAGEEPRALERAVAALRRASLRAWVDVARGEALLAAHREPRARRETVRHT